MTTLTFKDDAKIHPFSPAVAVFWDSQITTTNSRSYQTTPKWTKILQDNTIYHLFENIVKIFNFENHHQNNNSIFKNKEPQFYSIEFLNLLKDNNLDFTSILQNTMKQDPTNLSDYSYNFLLPIYSLWLKSNNETISNQLLESFLYYKKNQQTFFSNSDELIDTFFNLIDILEDKNISYSWFQNHLTEFAFSSFNLQDQIDNIDPLTYNISKHLTYESQLKIFNFVSKNFPTHISNLSLYYPSFLIEKSYFTQDLFETSFNINLHKFAFDNSMTNLDSSHIEKIATLCLSIYSSPEFIRNIEPNVSIISSKISSNYPSDAILIVSASTKTLEEKKDFQNFFIPTLLSIIKDCENIHLSYNDDYHGEEVLNTNLTIELFSKYYLHSKFNNSLELKPTVIKKIKI